MVFVDPRNLSKSFLHYNLAFLVITGVTETEFAVQLLCGFVSVDIAKDDLVINAVILHFTKNQLCRLITTQLNADSHRLTQKKKPCGKPARQQ